MLEFVIKILISFFLQKLCYNITESDSIFVTVWWKSFFFEKQKKKHFFFPFFQIKAEKIFGKFYRQNFLMLRRNSAENENYIKNMFLTVGSCIKEKK